MLIVWYNIMGRSIEGLRQLAEPAVKPYDEEMKVL